MKPLSILFAANPMNRKLVLSIFLLAYALLLGSAFAQPAAQAVPDQLQSVDGAARDDRQDAAAAIENVSRDAEVARIEAEVRRFKEEQALKAAGYAFWRDIVSMVVGVLTPIGFALVAWLQVKAARERKLMAQSINGMKTELVAQVRTAAFFEGAQLERERDNPDVVPVVARGLELSDDARKAGELAQILAAHAAGEKPSPLIGQSVSPKPTDAPDTPPKA